MPDTGLFYLMDVIAMPGASTQTTLNAILSVRAECLTCHHTMQVETQPSLTNILGGGAMLDCPTCRTRQAISGERFAAFFQRFPSGAAPPRAAPAALATQAR